MNPDAVADIDGDGVTNADEVANHTDPRSSDATGHLAGGYRYQIVSEDFPSASSASKQMFTTGVEHVGTREAVG